MPQFRVTLKLLVYANMIMGLRINSQVLRDDSLHAKHQYNHQVISKMRISSLHLPNGK